MKQYPIRDVLGKSPETILDSFRVVLLSMVPRMLNSVREFKITNYVIQPVTIFMVNKLRATKLTAKVLLHNKSMLCLMRILGHSNPFIAVLDKKPMTNLGLTWYGNSKGSTAFRAKNPTALIIMTPFYFILSIAVKTRYNVIKSSLLTRDFLYNLMCIHNIMILERSR